MLHPDFLRLPVAHRGLHAPGAPENTMPAFRAAIAAGYGIELDVQPAADGTPLVFHDDDLPRLAGRAGLIRDLSVAEAGALSILGSGHGAPTLAGVLAEVAGRVPLLIEIKDQDGALGPDAGTLPARVAAVLAGYGGPVAVMSFNPHIVAAFHRVAAGVACGLTSCAFDADEWPDVPAARRQAAARLDMFDAAGCAFISHDKADLGSPAVAALRSRGVPVLCWTTRSAKEEQAARRIADNVTFEGYRP